MSEPINPLTKAEREAIVAIFDGKTSHAQIAAILRMVALQVGRNATDFAMGHQLAIDIGKAIYASISEKN